MAWNLYKEKLQRSYEIAEPLGNTDKWWKPSTQRGDFWMHLFINIFNWSNKGQITSEVVDVPNLGILYEYRGVPYASNETKSHGISVSVYKIPFHSPLQTSCIEFVLNITWRYTTCAVVTKMTRNVSFQTILIYRKIKSTVYPHWKMVTSDSARVI